MIQTQTRAKPKLWIGIDFHKKTWRILCRTEEFSGNPFSMEPNPDLLKENIVAMMLKWCTNVDALDIGHIENLFPMVCKV